MRKLFFFNQTRRMRISLSWLTPKTILIFFSSFIRDIEQITKVAKRHTSKKQTNRVQKIVWVEFFFLKISELLWFVCSVSDVNKVSRPSTRSVLKYSIYCESKLLSPLKWSNLLSKQIKVSYASLQNEIIQIEVFVYLMMLKPAEERQWNSLEKNGLECLFKQSAEFRSKRIFDDSHLLSVKLRSNE